jgi:N-acetylmuramoyl-L-alanine amidase
MNRITWILDPGHGPGTPGKRSPFFPDGSQLMEFAFNRDVVERIAWEAMRPHLNMDVRVVPAADYKDMPRKERAEWANKQKSDLPKVFVSVHANASGNGSEWMQPSGVEVWHAWQSKQGGAIAEVFVSKLALRTQFRNRGTKSRENKQFTVLTKTQMPAILTESGFYDNREECELLMTDEYRDIIALAHVEAMIQVESLQL